MVKSKISLSSFSNRELKRGLLALLEMEIPIKWYERKWVTSLAMFLLSFPIVYYQLLNKIFPPPIAIMILSAPLSFFGTILDLYSTVQVARFIPAYKSRKLNFPYYERNAMLPNLPTSRQVLTNPINLVEIPLVIFSALIPGIGIMAFVGRGAAFLSNTRKAKRVKRGIEVYDKLKEIPESISC